MAPMPDTREQLVATMVHAILTRPGRHIDEPVTRGASLDANAVLPVVVKYVTDRVREMANLQALSCHASPLEYGPERPWLDLLALLDQIDAELGGE